MVALSAPGCSSAVCAKHTSEPRIDPDHVLLAAFDPFLSGYDEAADANFIAAWSSVSGRLPGVHSATLARRLPLTLAELLSPNVTDRRVCAGTEEDMRLETMTPSARINFQTMRVPLRAW